MKINRVRWILVIVLLLLVLSNAQAQNQTYIHIEKNNFESGEIVKIEFLTYNYDNLDLSIKTAKRNYQYNGEILGEINFLPQETGTHTIILKNKTTNVVLSETTFEVGTTTETNTEPTTTTEEPINNKLEQPLSIAIGNNNELTNIDLFKEQPTTVNPESTITINIILWNTQNKTNNITITETLPIDWQVQTYPSFATLNNNVLTFNINTLETDSTRVINYTAKAPINQTTSVFETLIEYVNKTETVTKNTSTTVSVKDDGSYFDTEIDLYLEDDEITRTIRTNITYDAEIKITNLGRTVSGYPVFYRWNYDETLLNVTPTSDDCKIRTNSGDNYLECEFKNFEAKQTRTATIQVTAKSEGFENINTKTLYDPPLTTILKSILNFLKTAFIQLYEALSDSITGQVIGVIEEPSIVYLEETVEEPTTPSTNDNQAPIAILESIPKFVSGTINLDAGNSRDLEEDFLSYKFIIANNQEFTNNIAVCEGYNPICEWNTLETENICEQECYVKAIVSDDYGTEESNIEKTSIDNYLPIIKRITPASGTIGKTVGTVTCDAQDNYQSHLEYLIEANYDGEWHTICYKDECQYDFSEVDNQDIAFKCTVKDEIFEVSKETETVRLKISSSKREKKPTPTKKIWYVTEKQQFIRTKNQETITITLQDSQQNNQTTNITIIADRNTGTSDVEIIVGGENIQKIEIINLNITPDMVLGIEEQPETQVIYGREEKTSYSINPENIDFEEAIITVTAQGEELWKCKDWNFTTQTCYGTWQKIKNIIPGEDYTFILTPDDPGYAETGLATVNTNKSIYHPNEEAEIIIAVLGTQGFLVSDANITLYVTNPQNQTTIYQTDNNEITETERGIYNAYYNQTNLTGRYDLFIQATGSGVNSSMNSFFQVESFYDYDILRGAPSTINPFSGPFNSSIRIISYVNVSTFNLTEQLPIEFKIEDAGGATVTETENKKQLLWTNLANNSEISYLAQAPLITPELWELGQAMILSSLGEFIELKPWYLAVDPVSDSRPTTFTDANNIGTNEANAYDEDFDSFALIDIDASPNPKYVEYITFNISGFNTESVLNQFNITYTVETTGTFSDDNWYLEYSTSNGTNWTTCYSADGVGTSKANFSCNVSFSAWTIQDFADSFQARVGGDKDGQADDAVAMNLYEIWATLNYTLPNFEPTPLSWAVNDTTIFENQTVIFNATWTDSDGTLDSWIFSWNITGSWVNLTAVAFTSNNVSNTTQLVNATEGTVVGWRFYANDTQGAWNSTPIETFTVLGFDGTPPTISNEAVTPTSVVSSTDFNITANVTDDKTVQNVWAEIQMPNGTKTNYSMSLLSGNLYSYVYSSQSGGNFSFIVYAFDGSNYNVSATRQYFNVTSYISAPKYYYARGDSVEITGIGYYAGGNVTLDITDTSGTSVSGYPVDVTADETGSISNTWSIPSSLTFKPGNYTINTTDNTINWLENITEVRVVIKPTTATTVSDTGTTDSLAEINDSDNIYTNIVSSNVEVYLQTNYTNVLPVGYKVSSAILYFEHYDVSAISTYVNWYNSSSATYDNLCIITNQSIETFNSCNLSSVVTNSSTLNGLSIRLSDNNLGGNNDNWTMIDFVYLDIDFSVSMDMSITLNEPTADVATKDYSDSNNKAYDGGNTVQPPASIVTGTEASSSEYTNLATSNDAYYRTSITGATGEHAYQSYKFVVSDAIADISSLTVSHEGYATEKVAQNPSTYAVYMWNLTNSLYQQITTASASSSDQTISGTFSGNGSDFINSTTGEVWVLVEGDFTTGGGPNAQADLWTDYIKLDVNKIPILTGMQNVNATVLDGNGVAACNYFYTYPNGTLASSYIGMTNYSNDIWWNTSDTNAYTDGFYYLYVNCTDGISDSRENVSIYVKIANTGPATDLVTPINYENFTYQNINFTWIATQSSQGILTCNLSIDGFVNQSGISSTSGENTTVNTTVSDGTHNWSVTCKDSSDLINTSTTRTFYVDTTNPTVTPNTPDNNYYTNLTSIDFGYTPLDANIINNCSLIINGVINQTNNTLIVNNTQNNFTVNNFEQGVYNWSVNCTDSFGWLGSSAQRNFTVDYTLPTINLTYPPNDQSFSNGTANFNYTVTDNLDSTLICNLSIDGSFSAANNNVASSNNTEINLTETGIIDGNHNWSVTCWDDTNNINYSEIRNFTMSGAPTVILQSPENNYLTNETFLNFTFYAGDGNNLSACEFYYDGSINQTKTSGELTNFGNNTFNLTSLDEGNHNWTVSCNDTVGTRTTASYYNLTIDRTAPTIGLYQPFNDDSFSVTTVNFNWTATDNLDTNLTCNLSIDGTFSGTNNNLNVTNGSTVSVSETINDGNHNWSVTCWDGTPINIINTNTSETRNFSVDGPPNVNLVNPSNNSKNQENVTFVYYVADVLGIANCTFIFDGEINQTINGSNITNNANNNLTLNNIPGGLHNWTFNCTDTGGQTNQPSEYYVTVDTTNPITTAIYPDGDTLNSNDVLFNFSVTDDVSTSMTCNISVDDGSSKSLSATNNTNTSTTITGITEGFHYWNVTCLDEANNSHTSSNLNFTIDISPVVGLDLPVDESADTDGNVTFTFIVDDGSLANCSLIINNQINQTYNASEIPYQDGSLTNNFSINNTAQGLYNWTVNCTDTNGFTGTDTQRELHVDWTAPNNISLNNPLLNETLYASSVTFNWTAYDNVDPILSCNLTINGTVNQTNVNSTNGQPTTKTVTGFSAGLYLWNVTCIDNAGLTNYSETRNFTISSEVIVTLGDPENNSVDGDGNVTFFFTPSSIAGFDSFGTCELYIDGVSNETYVRPLSGSESNLTPDILSEGLHTWYMNCSDDNSQIGLSETRNLYIDFVDPTIVLNYPTGQTLTTSTVNLNWTATDNLDTTLVCNLTINGIISGLNIDSPNGTATNYSVSNLNDSIHFWNVTCVDNGQRTNTSDQGNFTIQEVPKVGLISPSGGTRTANVNWTMTYLPTDNSNIIKNCTLILNGANNQTNTSVTESQQNNFTLSNMADGTYTWDVNCSDENNNYGVNGSADTFYVDLLGPTINLTVPDIGQTFNYNNIDFNWTPTDFAGTTITCNLSVSDPLGGKNSTNISGLSGTNFNTTVFNLSDGTHFWNVTCWDNLGNSNTSENRNFTINQPDLYTNNSLIYFNNTNPDLNENITISVNISNIGGSPANNVLVEFWDGLPGSGTFIGNDTATVAVNATITFNISWLINAGYHNIWVATDPNNAIDEENELNNNATTNISVLRSILDISLNNTWTTSNTTEINFTLQDYVGGTVNYTIFVDGSANGQIGTVSDNVSTLLNVTFSSEGIHYIVVQATDNLSRLKNSTALYINYDETNPVPNFETLNGTFFNDTNPLITFNITDNLASTINYTLYVDGTADKNGTINEGISTNINLSTLAEGKYNLTLQGMDQAGNAANGSIIIFIDQTEPTINLTYPPNNNDFETTTVDLNFTVIDYLDDSLLCNVTLDGTVINESITVANNTENTRTVSDLSEGAHYWNVTCWDGRDNSNIINTNTSESRIFNVFIPPTIILVSPDNATWSNNVTNTFYFNVSDDIGLENCSLMLNGVVNETKSGVQLTNNGQNNLSVNGLNGTYDWGIQCYDNTSYNTYNLSENRTFYADVDAPYPYIETANESWFNTATPQIDFNITDNMDSVLNYTFYVNGSSSTQGTVNNATSDSANLQALTNGTYSVMLEGTDEATNARNSSSIIIYVDTVLPTIQLNSPANGNITSNSTVYFNVTANDNMAPTMDCNLTVDGIVETNVTANNGVAWTYNENFAAGLHWWNVTCLDLAGNINTSESSNFTIPAPDIYIQSSYIVFNESNPVENQTITINATVINIGNTDADNFTVQFYRGDPDSGGTQINGNKTINGLTAGQNSTVNVSYNTIIGSNDIFVVVDTPLATNGSISEVNESNNKASNSFTVEQFHIVAGTTNDKLKFSDASYITLFTWELINLTGSNVYVVDTDSSIAWDSLQAISRNTSNASTTDDFEEIDTVFGSTAYPDSINTTYSLNGAPRSTQTFDIFSNLVQNVPIVNSTNTSDFVTGILWDYSDGNSEYNGTQDLIFVTEINENRTGEYGTYDYEIKIPAPLRSYIGTIDTVTFYTEIK